jgi:CheY-like chemotaxis protein
MPNPESDSPEPPIILVVDDSAIDRRVAGRVLEKSGWLVAYAADGALALEQIAAAPPSLVVTDMQMPNLDGLALVEQIRERFPRVPVILMTGHGSEAIAIAALKAGASGYVPKRSLADDLPAAVEQVLAASKSEDHRHRVFDCQTRRSARFVLDNDPSLVQPLIAVLQQDVLNMGLCDATAVTRIGVALEEALLNAIYHGNLGVSSKLKENDDKLFYSLASERRNEMPYRERRVRMVVRMSHDEAAFVIADDGPGFDVASLPDPTDPAYLDRPSGRGLLLMRAFMDEIRYNPTGNRVELVKRRDRCGEAA